MPFQIEEGWSDNLQKDRPRQKWVRYHFNRRPVSILTETNVSKVQTAASSMSVKGVGSLSHLANVPSVGHIAISAKSPSIFDFWKENLKTHPDLSFVQTILDGIKYGEKIVYDGPQMSLDYDSWPSSLEHSDKVTEIIRKKIECGDVAGLFPPSFSTFSL